MTLASVTVSGPTPAVAGGTRIGTGRIRANAEAAGIGVQDRAAAGRHGVGCASLARGLRTPATSVSKARSNSPAEWATSVEVPPMSKPMTREKPASSAGAHHADDAAGGAGQDRVLALELFGRRQPTRRHHELKRRAGLARRRGAQRVGHPLDIAAAGSARDRRRRTVVSPRPTSLMSGETSWLTETCVKPIFTYKFGDRRLVLRVLPGVHFKTIAIWPRCRRPAGRFQRRAHGFEVQRHLDRAVRAISRSSTSSTAARLELFREARSPWREGMSGLALVGDPQRIA